MYGDAYGFQLYRKDEHFPSFLENNDVVYSNLNENEYFEQSKGKMKKNIQ